MRYQVERQEIRSENAAKPADQASRHTIEAIMALSGVKKGLDYGCGKLRYGMWLHKVCRRVTFLDSCIQLSRKQILFGEKTTVTDYVSAHWPWANVLEAEHWNPVEREFDLILRANVLSTIPAEAARRDVMRRISASLMHNGKCLLVTQYTNSYFRKIAASKKSERHLDGWLLKSLRGLAFYGIINKEGLMCLARQSGLRILRSWVAGQSAFVLATK